jgi:hypothetical protein
MTLNGDPTPLGWATTALYFIGALRAAGNATKVASPADRRIWQEMLVALIVLGINKEMDLQSTLIASARAIFKVSGPTVIRDILYAVFLITLFSISGAYILKRKLDYSRFARANKMAVLGGFFIFGYAIARAISISHLDEAIGINLDSISLLWMLEIIGLMIVFLNRVEQPEKPA